MKSKSSIPQPKKPIEAWRRILPRLAAIFLIIVFLASECAALLPGQ